MNRSSTRLILTSLLLVLVFKLAYTDASALFNEQSMMESTASDENDASLRSKKDASLTAAQHFIPSPHRRHHLKFGVLGKRYAYGYLGKRNDVPQINSDFEEWLNDMRDKRAGRPLYGMLG